MCHAELPIAFATNFVHNSGSVAEDGATIKQPTGLVDGYGGDESDDDSAGAAPPAAAAAASGIARKLQQDAERKRAAEAEKKASAARRTATLKSDPSLAKFEEHSKGIGSKLLRSMGWKPGEGLGAKRHGISKPLEAKLRPQGAGLGAAGVPLLCKQSNPTGALSHLGRAHSWWTAAAAITGGGGSGCGLNCSVGAADLRSA